MSGNQNANICGFIDWLIRLDLVNNGFKSEIGSDESTFVRVFFDRFRDGILLAKLAQKIDPTISEEEIRGRAVFKQDRTRNIGLFKKACTKKKIGFQVGSKYNLHFPGLPILYTINGWRRSATFLKYARAYYLPYYCLCSLKSVISTRKKTWLGFSKPCTL